MSLSDRIRNPGAPFIAAGIAAILGLAIGVVASPSEPLTVEVPGPTQTIEVDVPGPTQVVEVPGPTIEVAPTACMDAIDDLVDGNVPYVGFTSDVLNDYLDFPDETVEQFGVRVEQRLNDLDLATAPVVPELAIAQCRAAS